MKWWRIGAGVGAVVLFLGTTSITQGPPRGNAETGTVIVDLMAAYTDGAAASAGGDGEVRGRIRDQVIMVNEVLANSGIDAQVRLVDTRRLTRYSGPEGHLAAMDKIKADSEVSQARQELGADLVSVFVAGDQKEDGYGVGAMPLALPVDSVKSSDQAFSVLAVSKMPPHGLAHELGHNFGAGHDWLDPESRYRSAPANRGYGSPHKDWVTVMSYQDICDGCPGLAPFYSTPTKKWYSEPVGVSADADSCDTDIFRRPADNAGVVASTISAVAEYRPESPVNAAKSVVLTARVEPVEGGRAVPATPGPHVKGDDVTLTATARAGYSFKEWQVDGRPKRGTDSGLSVKMDEAHQVVAVFEPNQAATLTIDIKPSAEAGSVRTFARTLPGSPSVPTGGQFTGLAPQPADGWKLDSWQLDGQTIPPKFNGRLDLPMPGNRELTVNFVRADPHATPPMVPVVAMNEVAASANPRPAITGTATPDSVVTITDGNRGKLGTTRVSGDGRWRLMPPWDLGAGANTLRATAGKNGKTSAEVTGLVTVTGATGSVGSPTRKLYAHQVGDLVVRQGEMTAVEVALETCETVDFTGWSLAVLMPAGFSARGAAGVRRGNTDVRPVGVELVEGGRMALVTTVPNLNTGPGTKGPLTFTLWARADEGAQPGTSADGAIGLAQGRQISRMAALTGAVRPKPANTTADMRIGVRQAMPLALAPGESGELNVSLFHDKPIEAGSLAHRLTPPDGFGFTGAVTWKRADGRTGTVTARHEGRDLVFTHTPELGSGEFAYAIGVSASSRAVPGKYGDGRIEVGGHVPETLTGTVLESGESVR